MRTKGIVGSTSRHQFDEGNGRHARLDHCAFGNRRSINASQSADVAMGAISRKARCC